MHSRPGRPIDRGTERQVWKPPCDAEYIGTATIGCIRGWARRFWQHSVDHRGTSTAPGRVATILHRTHPDMAVAATARATRAAGASAADGRGHGDGHGDDADGGSVPPTGPTELVTAGMVYTITDMATILPMLDFREKNGYTRTVVDVFDPENLDRKINRAIMCVDFRGHASVVDAPPLT
jgi:cation transport regulator ChaC